MARIVRVFGPDGAGKSSIIRSIVDTTGFESLVIEGSRPSSWPDGLWHAEATSRDLAPTDPQYHLQTLARCYEMIGGLLAQTSATIIIDSDPQHTIAAKAHVLQAQPLAPVYKHLGGIAGQYLGSEIRQTGLHVTVGGLNDERGDVLFKRIADRGELSALDPNSPEAASALAAAYDSLEHLWNSEQGPCLRIETDSPVDTEVIARQLI